MLGNPRGQESIRSVSPGEESPCQCVGSRSWLETGCARSVDDAQGRSLPGLVHPRSWCSCPWTGGRGNASQGGESICGEGVLAGPLPAPRREPRRRRQHRLGSSSSRRGWFTLGAHSRLSRKMLTVAVERVHVPRFLFFFLKIFFYLRARGSEHKQEGGAEGDAEEQRAPR